LRLSPPFIGPFPSFPQFLLSTGTAGDVSVPDRPAEKTAKPLIGAADLIVIAAVRRGTIARR
jgi:hypothetical protein